MIEMRLESKTEGINHIQRQPNGTVLVDYGPMRMHIHVSEKGNPLPGLAEEGGCLAIRLLNDLAECLPLLKKRSYELRRGDSYPEVLRRMIEATLKMEEPDLTPLAAVAGTASEMVADFIFHKGGTKVIVDNGGDIAIRLKEGEKARIGIKTEVEAERPTYLFTIDSTMGIEGVATSGLGGRSFTKGIASGATVFSKRASFADAAATIIGNFTDVEDSGIIRSPAEKIYPDTDIVGQWVTIEVGRLPRQKVDQALENGLSKAMTLCQRELIYGALIAVKGRAIWTDSLAPHVIPL